MNRIRSDGIQKVNSGSSSLPWSQVDRLIKFYHHLKVPVDLSPIWEGIVKFQHKPMLDVFESGDHALVGESLNHIYDRDLTGLIIGITISGEGVDIESTLSRLEGAAVNWGVIPLFNPEQPDALSWSAPEVIDLLERESHGRFGYRGSPGMMGIDIGGRFLHYKYIEAIGHAANIWKLTPYDAARILEIGGGSGILCCVLTGLLHPDQYHLVDLPTTSVFQAYTLMQEGIEVWLSGEPLPDAKTKVFIHGPIPDYGMVKNLNLAINHDSMPEMTHAEQRRHLEFIERSLRRGGLFISQNHESTVGQQRRVLEAAREAFTSMRHSFRQRSWMRVGYVDELWTKL